MIKVKLKNDFIKKYKSVLIRYPELTEVVPAKIHLFENNPDDTRLRNHALTKRLNGKWAFSITGEIRIVYEWIGANTVRFLNIGTHPEVY